MKIKSEHFDRMKKEIENVLNSTMSNVGDIYIACNLSEKRMRWDLLLATGWITNGFMKELYEYLTDDHIDTALKKIVEQLKPKLYKAA